LWEIAPGLAVVMGIFLASLAGVPFFAGWFAKFVMFRAIIDAGTGWAIALAIIAAVNSVIAFFFYARPIRAMIFHAPTTEDRTPIVIPQPLFAAIALTVAVVVLVGIYPQVFARVGELAF
jgi:NADH-quinone oxidoreductase subunit N